MKITKTITPLITRVIVFLAIFGLISGLIGPRIIASDILFRDGFGVYGGLGKALIFGLIVFILLARRRRARIKLGSWRLAQASWFVLAAVMFGIAWASVSGLLAHERTFANLFLAHSGLILSVLWVVFGSFGLSNLERIWQAYRRELVVTTGLTVLFYIFLQMVYMLWQPLASLVLISVAALIEWSGLTAAVVPPHTLVLDKFGITIAEFCSGVESIALFTSLYIIVGVLDWPRVHRQRYFIVFPIALFVLCLLNIGRVYGLIMAGYYINPEIAFSLFHTYAGMIFFIIYSAIFWAIAYNYIIPRRLKHETTPRA